MTARQKNVFGAAMSGLAFGIGLTLSMTGHANVMTVLGTGFGVAGLILNVALSFVQE